MLQDLCEQKIDNRIYPERHPIIIEAGTVGLKVRCNGQEFYASDYGKLLHIIDLLITTAGQNTFEISTKYVNRLKPTTVQGDDPARIVKAS